jgi:hypothetical protein
MSQMKNFLFLEFYFCPLNFSFLASLKRFKGGQGLRTQSKKKKSLMGCGSRTNECASQSPVARSRVNGTEGYPRLNRQ